MPRKFQLQNFYKAENKFYPVGLPGFLLLLTLALFLGSVAYNAGSQHFHGKFRQSLMQADIGCAFLKSFPQTSVTHCRSEKHENGNGMTSSALEGAANTMPLWLDNRMTPRDMVELLASADVLDADKYTAPLDLLKLETGEVETWLATLALGKSMVGSQTIADVFIRGAILCGNNHRPVGSLEVLFKIFEVAGRESSDPLAQLNQGCVGETSVLTPSVKSKLNDLIEKHISGIHPSLWKPWSLPETEPAYTHIKEIMQEPFGLYTAERTRNYKDATVGPEPADGLLLQEALPSLQQLTYVPKAEDGIQYRPAGQAFGMGDRAWYRGDPIQLSAAINKLANTLMDQILREDAVKSARFAYQAWRGPIQWLIFVAFFLVALNMVWRMIALVRSVRKEGPTLVMAPTLQVGQIAEENREDALFQSRRILDQMINLLPVLGLFGTVMGILGGLPSASAAITAEGPTASATINLLFEELGLAFSTTALAVISVLILQLAWEIIQRLEDRYT